MKLNDNPFLVKITPHEIRLIMGAYATFLATGNNLVCRSILSSTIREYLKAVGKLFIEAGHDNPTLTTEGRLIPNITNILDEQKRWEGVANRRDPLTVDMVYAIAQNAKSAPLLSLTKALSDWFSLGIIIGPRLSEWAQDSTYPTQGLQRNCDGSIKAFILQDFEFRGKNNRRLPTGLLPPIEDIHSVIITWRFQKNKENGQTITVSRNYSHPLICPVQAAYRICQHFISLKGP